MRWILARNRVEQGQVQRAGERLQGRLYPTMIFHFEEVNRMPEKLYLYSFDEEGERAQFYFSSIEEALEDARRNVDEEEIVYIWQEEQLELCVRGEEVIEDMRRQMDEEGLDEDYLECPEQSAIDELSDMLTKTFRVWADKHGYEKSIPYGTNTELYDLKTGRPVLE